MISLKRFFSTLLTSSVSTNHTASTHHETSSAPSTPRGTRQQHPHIGELSPLHGGVPSPSSFSPSRPRDGVHVLIKKQVDRQFNNIESVDMDGKKFEQISQLVASDVIRLISHMKMDGSQLVDASVTPHRVEDGCVKLFTRFMQLIDVDTNQLSHFSSPCTTTAETNNSEQIRNNIEQLFENLLRDNAENPNELRKLKTLLQTFSLLTQQSIASAILELKYQIKERYGHQAKMFDGRKWTIDINLIDTCSPSETTVEIIHHRTERLCLDTSGSTDDLNTPRGMEDVCRFTWSLTFRLQIESSLLRFDSSKLDLEQVTDVNPTTTLRVPPVYEPLTSTSTVTTTSSSTHPISTSLFDLFHTTFG